MQEISSNRAVSPIRHCIGHAEHDLPAGGQCDIRFPPGPRGHVLFNSFLFWAFFAVVWSVYLRLDHKNQNRLLLVASYLFYGAWDWRFLGLLGISTLMDYGIALGLGRAESRRSRKALLTLSIATNLGLLGFFKYYNFFAAEFADLLGMVGLTGYQNTLNIILPIGISFYTFQTLSYTIDVYRGELRPTRNLLDFAVFVAFFPGLVAGPIERATALLPQICNRRRVSSEDLRAGAYDVVYGLFLKVALADNMAPVANYAFESSASSGGDILLGVYAFALQIYGDFAGYSLMARGIARFFGITLMLNFKRPYFARNPSDFWNRWHISLSSWLRDYLYIPLGGNRAGRIFTYRNLMITMLLGGLWHGAAWTFVVWGGLHGLILVAYRAYGEQAKSQRSSQSAVAVQNPSGLSSGFSTLIGQIGQRVLFFHLVCLTWVFFRAESVPQAVGMLTTIITDPGLTSFGLGAASLIAFFAAPVIAFEIWMERAGGHDQLLEVRWWKRGLAYSYCAFMVLFFPPLSSQAFIYFQF